MIKLHVAASDGSIERTGAVLSRALVDIDEGVLLYPGHNLLSSCLLPPSTATPCALSGALLGKGVNVHVNTTMRVLIVPMTTCCEACCAM